jgi:hypothetical protein
MKRGLALLFGTALMASTALAAGPKDYQVTGPVLDLTEDVIVVEKGKEKWEIGRNKDTKIKGDLKKGSRVTIQYKMTATSVESKDAPKTTTQTKPETKPKTTK